MKRSMSIKENRIFKRLYYRGKSFVTPQFILYVSKARHSEIKVGITASKKTGSAVDRNRAKRVIRAAFDSVLDNIENGYDFVIVARPKICEEKSTTVALSLKKQLKAAGVWREI